MAGFTIDVCDYATVTAGYDLGYHVYALKESMAGYTQPLSEMMLHSVYVLWSQVLSNEDFIALVDAYHREARRRQTLSSAPPPSDAARVPFFDDLVDDQVVHAIDALPLSYREVVVLRDIEDLHYAEVATVLGVPVGTVRSRLFRAREILQKKLLDYAVSTGLIKG